MSASEEVHEYNIRLVTLGGGKVGKSSILKRFLFNTYCEKYRPTVEEIYHHEFNIGSACIKVDIMDTAGDLQFPAMRRLAIGNGQAFLLVYSINNEESFEEVKQCFKEIQEYKQDFQAIPIILVGNKNDLPEEKRKIRKEDASEWLFCECPKLRCKLMECSAKENTNIKELFKNFLYLAKIPIPSLGDQGLRRRSSAHGPVGRSNSSKTATSSPEHEASAQRFKPRSRSLIRRTSKKIASRFKEPTQTGTDGDDCLVS